MHYETELAFLRRTLKKMRIQSAIIDPHEVPDEKLDLGLRKFLGHGEEYLESFRTALTRIRENTIYRLADAYFCNYIFFILPGTMDGTSLLLGPYTSFEPSREQIMEEAERFGIPAPQFRQLENYYRHIPVIPDDTALFILLNVLAESMWGEGSAYEIVDLNQDIPGPHSPVSPVTPDSAKDDSLLQMQIMEARYAYENELMENVSKGLIHRAELMLSRFSQVFFELRTADPLRNAKNYCIICNTLMRKAAEKGGVHPMHLDIVSSDYARKIELVPSPGAAQDIMMDMVHSYCRLVRKHSMKGYSHLIRKTISLVESDLSADLSLSSVAAAQNVSAGYLSSLFKKETGKTFTEFVSEKRVETGAKLLRTTRLQVQTIAEHCGMPDANYFTKIFKKFYKMSPRQFRERHTA